jgi:hypothetical protein
LKLGTEINIVVVSLVAEEKNPGPLMPALAVRRLTASEGCLQLLSEIQPIDIQPFRGGNYEATRYIIHVAQQRQHERFRVKVNAAHEPDLIEENPVLPDPICLAGTQFHKAFVICSARALVDLQRTPALVRVIGVILAGSLNSSDRMRMPFFGSILLRPLSIDRFRFGRGVLRVLKKNDVVWIISWGADMELRRVSAVRAARHARATAR